MKAYLSLACACLCGGFVAMGATLPLPGPFNPLLVILGLLWAVAAAMWIDSHNSDHDTERGRDGAEFARRMWSMGEKLRLLEGRKPLRLIRRLDDTRDAG